MDALNNASWILSCLRSSVVWVNKLMCFVWNSRNLCTNPNFLLASLRDVKCNFYTNHFLTSFGSLNGARWKLFSSFFIFWFPWKMRINLQHWKQIKSKAATERNVSIFMINKKYFFLEREERKSFLFWANLIFIVIWYFSQFSFPFVSINKAISIMIHIELFVFIFLLVDKIYFPKIHLIGCLLYSFICCLQLVCLRVKILLRWKAFLFPRKNEINGKLYDEVESINFQMKLKIRKIVYDWKSFAGFSFGVVFIEAHASGTRVIKFSNTLLSSESIDWKQKEKREDIFEISLTSWKIQARLLCSMSLHLCIDAEWFVIIRLSR